jgi:hypothetical protein
MVTDTGKMKRPTLALLLLVFTFNIYAADISDLLYSFSPLAQIYLKHLGLEDKNNNGVIETAAIESEVKAYIYANNLPLLWLDDEQGTVMNAVTNILGEGWNEQEVNEDEAVRMFNRVMYRLNISGRTGEPGKSGGYYSLPEFITKRKGFCFEIAQFGFWFFSELKINSVCAQAYLSTSVLHEVVKLKSGRIVDYYARGGRISSNNWHIDNPLQGFSIFYHALTDTGKNSITLMEDSVMYNKYYLNYSYGLLYFLRTFTNTDNHVLITLGEFILDNIDINIIMRSNNLDAARVRDRVKNNLLVLGIAYAETGDRTKLQNIVELLTQHFRNDRNVRQFIDYYSR